MTKRINEKIGNYYTSSIHSISIYRLIRFITTFIRLIINRIYNPCTKFTSKKIVKCYARP